ncbi:hypothetical protein EB233_08085 [Mesorhizobium erdmanii]|uniref:Uncharacterized protein n=1 Tax=Mesorhizobium erdmanii TaxID=1777866 RepID=A0A6M7UE32_9HYPH|nr:hypothetical protein A8146_22910 [Mesorhizobium loti]QKC75511.1 hypothetical protein EB233_08085 [Mesorhizobium erdmanii]
MFAEFGARLYLGLAQAIQIGPDDSSTGYRQQVIPLFIRNNADKILEVAPEIDEQTCERVGM